MFDNFQLIVSDIKIIGYEWEIPQPKAVMCIIHGIGEHAGRYDRMAGYLAEKGIAVVSVDLPGHGLSEGKRGHAAPRETVLNVVTAMLEYTEGKYPEIPVTLYGHSMGGNINLDYRARGERNAFPAKYIVSAPWIKLVKNVPTPLYRIVRAVSGVLPTIQMSTGCEPEDLGNLELTAYYNEDPLVHKFVTIRTAADCIDIANAMIRGMYMDNKRAKGKPLLLMHGDMDRICDIEGSRMIAERFKREENFTYIEWEGYCHEMHNGGPNHMGEEVIFQIRDFVLE